MTTPLPKTLDLSLAAEGVGNAVIVPAETDGPYFTLIGQGDATDEEQNAIAREIVRRWNEWREPVPTTPPLTAARIEEMKARHARLSSDRRQFWTAAESAMVADIAALLADIERLRDRIDNANQAASETHRNWQSRCYAIMAALGEDYGDALEDSSHGG